MEWDCNNNRRLFFSRAQDLVLKDQLKEGDDECRTHRDSWVGETTTVLIYSIMYISQMFLWPVPCVSYF